MMTKQEERAALAKIEKIISAAGPDSYIGMAFAGCCELARTNIENDFGCSMQNNIDTWRGNAEREHEMRVRCENRIEELSRALDRHIAEKDDLRDQLKETRDKLISDSLYNELYMTIYEKQVAAEQEMQKITEAISYCDPSGEADREAIAGLIKRLQEERPRRDSAKALLKKLEAHTTW